MADQDLGMTGKDVTIEMIVDGAPVEIADAVTEFTETPEFDVVTRKHLGTTRRDIDYIPVGWSGSITLTAKTRAVEDALDFYIQQKRLRIPVEVTITSQKIFRNGDVKADTYLDVQFMLETRMAREDAVEYTLSWESGRDRVSV